METIKEQTRPDTSPAKKPDGRKILVEMLDRKRRIQEYVRSGDESKRPTDVKFVNPFTLSPEED